MSNSGASKQALIPTLKKQNKNKPLITLILYFWNGQDTQRLEDFKSFESLLNTCNASNQDDIAVRLFQYQAIHNPVYAQYLQNLDTKPQEITRVEDIPFLPISFFKSQTLK